MSNYEMRAMEAIHAFKGKAVSYPAIRKQVLAMFPDATNENALRLALKNGVPRGAFAKEKASYVLTAASRRQRRARMLTTTRSSPWMATRARVGSRPFPTANGTKSTSAFRARCAR